MTLLWIDGFDHYTTAQFVDKGYTINGASITANGRFGGGSAYTFISSYYFKKNFGVNKSTIYTGIAIKKITAGNPAYSATYPLIFFYDESGVVQVRVHITAGFELSAYNGAGTLLGTSASSVVPDQTWFHLEVKVTVSDTVGVVEINVDGTQVLNLTSKDTKYGSDYIRSIQFGTIYSSKYTYWDDFYIDDAQFHGNCEVKTFMPDADGNSSDFTRSGGSNDYECVDENPSNEETDYISSGTANHKSIFGITTGSLSTVKGIQVNTHCRIEEAGSREITPIVRSNGTDYSGTETDNIDATYGFKSEVFEDDPDDSNPWTQTKLEAAEFGLEITT